MNKEPEQIIFPESPEAARLQTVTGWVWACLANS